MNGQKLPSQFELAFQILAGPATLSHFVHALFGQRKQPLTSKALQAKIARLRDAAPRELPKARLCAEAIMSLVDEDATEDERQTALAALKAGVGNNWSYVTALQFMSGRQAALAIEFAQPNEKAALYLSHLMAKSICDAQNYSGADRPDNIDFAKLRSMVAEFMEKNPESSPRP